MTKLFLGILTLILMTGCAFEPASEDDNDMSRVTAAMLTDMVAGSNAVQNNLVVNDLEPGTYTLQFSIISIEPSPNLKLVIPPVVQAIVTWKVEGQQQRRLVSVVSGASISSVAEAVDVKIQDIDNGEDVGYRYQVQVTLSKGLRANTQQPPQLSRGRFVLIPAQTEFAFPVPQDAGVISFFVYVGLDANLVDFVSLGMFDAVNNTVAVLSPIPNGTQWIPVIPATTEVRITNGHATDGVFANLIWGIDG